MFYFKNKNESSSNNERRSIPGLSKYWRYSTLDSQNNNNNLYNKSSIPSNPKVNNRENYNSPNDITIEVSYDNFYVMGVDMMKKKKYAEELKAQIEQKKYLKRLEQEKRKLDEINDDIRIQKERKQIEEREKQSNKIFIPKINLKPLPKKDPVKILTPRVPIPPKLITKYKTPIKTKYIYKRKSSEEVINKYIKEREMNLERFNTDINEQINGIKRDFNSGIKKLNDEIDKINYRIDDKNKAINDLIYKKKTTPIVNKKNNIDIEHIFSVIKKNKDGKFTIQQFINNNMNKFPLDFRILNSFDVNNCEEKSNDVFSLPYINLSHHIAY